jgi:uncharacterized protein YktB (UPF0637 family)
MTSTQFKAHAKAQFETMSVESLVAEIKKLKDNVSASANMVFDTLLDHLLAVMPEDQFSKLCVELDD